MKTQNQITQLNIVLANLQMYYQNLRAYHWNVRGKNFFELHVKFEEYYTAAALAIDSVAERILTLGGTPLHTFEDYLTHASIKSDGNRHNGTEMVELLISYHNIIIQELRVSVSEASAINDEGTNDILTPLIQQLEKNNWMLKAYLG
jgi:starvation-inducible DNA-binding protein